MKKVMLALLLLSLASCADQVKRMEYVKKKFPPPYVVMAPYTYGGTGRGTVYDNYDIIVIDTMKNVFGVDFYVGSETKVYRFDLIKSY